MHPFSVRGARAGGNGKFCRKQYGVREGPRASPPGGSFSYMVFILWAPTRKSRTIPDPNPKCWSWRDRERRQNGSRPNARQNSRHPCIPGGCTRTSSSSTHTDTGRLRSSGGGKRRPGTQACASDCAPATRSVWPSLSQRRMRCAARTATHSPSPPLGATGRRPPRGRAAPTLLFPTESQEFPCNLAPPGMPENIKNIH